MVTDHIQPIGEPQTAYPLQRQWPQLGKELYTLERALATHFVTYGHSLTDQEIMQRVERVRNRVFAQLYSEDEKYTPETRYCAFLVVKDGKAGEIGGNLSLIHAHGMKQELPYTGLEGYRAGSVRTSQYPGMTPEGAVQEEAYIGLEMLRTLKKHAIERYTWASFAKMKKGLESGEPDIEDLKSIEVIWADVVRRLHVRVYDNREFAMTISEQIGQLDKLVSTTPTRTEEEGKSEYGFAVSDSHWTDATIIETMRLPKTHARNEYPSIQVTLTPAQVEGYLFLVESGDIGGDSLARSGLSST